MGAIESTMAQRDANGYPMDILQTETKREKDPKHDRARRESLQTFYSANEGSESDDDGYHSPGIEHEAAWSPLEKKNVSGTLQGPFDPFLEPCSPVEPQVPSRLGTPFSGPEMQKSPVEPHQDGRLKEPFSSFLEPCSPTESQVSSSLGKPFSVPERRMSHMKPRVSNRLDKPFSGSETQRFPVQRQMSGCLDKPSFGPEQVHFAPSSSYDNENATRARKVKLKPESTTSLNSQLTREIKNFHGHEPAASNWQTPINPRDGDVPRPLNTAGIRSNRSNLSKKQHPSRSDINLPPRPVQQPRSQQQHQQRGLLPQTRAVRQPRLQKILIPKRPPPPLPLPLKKSSHKFSGSGPGPGPGSRAAVSLDISTLSGTPYIQSRRPLEKITPRFHEDFSKDLGKPSFRRQGEYHHHHQQQQQQQQEKGKEQLESQHSPVSPLSSGPNSPLSCSLQSPPSPINSHPALLQKQVISSQPQNARHDSNNKVVEILQPRKLKPQRVFLSTESDGGCSDSQYFSADSEISSNAKEGDSRLDDDDDDDNGADEPRRRLLLIGRFEFELDIPVSTETYEEESEPEPDSQTDATTTMSAKRKDKRPARLVTKTIDATPIEECLEITDLEIMAAVDRGTTPFYLEFAVPRTFFAYRMNDKQNDSDSDSDNTAPPPQQETRKVRYYGVVRDLRFPRDIKECTLSTSFTVKYPPGTDFFVQVEDWNKVDIRKVRERGNRGYFFSWE